MSFLKEIKEEIPIRHKPFVLIGTREIARGAHMNPPKCQGPNESTLDTQNEQKGRQPGKLSMHPANSLEPHAWPEDLMASVTEPSWLMPSIFPASHLFEQPLQRAALVILPASGPRHPCQARRPSPDTLFTHGLPLSPHPSPSPV